MKRLILALLLISTPCFADEVITKTSEGKITITSTSTVDIQALKENRERLVASIETLPQVRSVRNQIARLDERIKKAKELGVE